MANASLADHKFYVYVHSRLSNGESFYVGKGFGKRSHSKNGRNRYWERIVAKDDGFHVSILTKNIDEEFAMLIEMESIALLRLRGCSLVNMTDGGEGTSGYYPSEETRKKLSESSANKGKPAWNRGLPSWNRGIKQTKETIAKLSKIRTGKKHTESHKINISNALMGKRKSEQAKENMRIAFKGRESNNKGKTFSDEWRQKIAIANTGKTHSPETRAKLSESHKGKTAWNNGKKHSAESRLKMSLAHKGKPTGRKGIARPLDVREKIAAKLRGRTLTAEHAENISRGLKERKK